eukprot:3287223-Karenia_brevis.AAC.1
MLQGMHQPGRLWAFLNAGQQDLLPFRLTQCRALSKSVAQGSADLLNAAQELVEARIEPVQKAVDEHSSKLEYLRMQ